MRQFVDPGLTFMVIVLVLVMFFGVAWHKA